MLRKNHERIVDILDRLDDIIYELDASGKIAYMNSAGIAAVGMRLEDIAGKDFPSLFIGESQRLAEELLRKALKGKPEGSVLTFANGKIYRFKASPYINNGGMIEGVFGSGTDITQLVKTEKTIQAAYDELKKAQAKLVLTEKMRIAGMLANGIAHEVKNPLGTILQGIGYLERSVKSGDKNIAKTIAYMKKAVERADDIIGGLLDFSGPEKIEMRKQDLNSVIMGSLELIKYDLDKKHIQLITELGKDIPPVIMDRKKIEQMFLNIFINAAQAMLKGGRLTVRSFVKKLTGYGDGIGRRKEDMFRAGEDAAFVEIEDTGPGIPEGVLKHLFEPFFTTKQEFNGTGLGLWTVKNTADLHKAKIEIDNKKDKSGVKATFIFGA